MNAQELAEALYFVISAGIPEEQAKQIVEESAEEIEDP